MKIFKSLALLTFTLFLVTGCGNTLKCSKESEKSSYKEKETITIKWSKDKVTNFDTVTEMTFEDKDAAKSYYDTYSSVFELLDGTEGIENKHNLSGNKIKHTVKINAKKMTEGMQDLYLSEQSKKDAKTSFEDSGYKCN